MNAMTQLRVVRVILAIGALLRGIAWGLSAAFTLFAGAALIDLATPLSLDTRHLILAVAVVSAVSVGASMCWRDRGVLSLESPKNLAFNIRKQRSHAACSL